jgi:hypothetical protein
MKLKTAGLVTVAAGISLFGAGCSGGGSGNGSSSQSPQRFAGNYSGAYVAIGSESGGDVSGVFNGTTDAQGRVAGTVTQDGGLPPFPATGTIGGNGAVNLTANGSIPTTPPITFSTVLGGTATINNGDAVFGGTLLTTQSDGNNPRGRFVGIRNVTGTSPFAGSYNGTFTGRFTNGGTTFGGTLAMTVNSNGLIRGTFSRTGTNIRVRPLVGTIDRSGNAQLVALAEVEVPADSNNFLLVVNQLTGKGTTTSSNTRITGSLNRTGDPSINATGTFTATRTATTQN